MKNNLSLKATLPLLTVLGKKLWTSMSFLAFLLLAATYAFVIIRINNYSNPTVTNAEVTDKAAGLPTLHIDEQAAEKLKTLEDNSVNVQTLFDEGRTNPFHE